MRTLVALLVALGMIAMSGWAWAGRCKIHNDTGTSFTIESGNTSNQRVGSHTHTSISSGKIKAKSDDGKTINGKCESGDKIKIIKKGGGYSIVPQ